MPSIETTIEVAAPPRVAYQKLMGFDKYPEWNPFIKKISGDKQVGSSLEAHIQLPGSSSPMTFKPKVLVNDENKEFRWVGTFLAKPVMTGEHYFIFKPNGKGTTFVHGEEFGGLLGGLMVKLCGEQTKQGFENMNQAFKAVCES